MSLNICNIVNIVFLVRWRSLRNTNVNVFSWTSCYYSLSSSPKHTQCSRFVWL